MAEPAKHRRADRRGWSAWIGAAVVGLSACTWSGSGESEPDDRADILVLVPAWQSDATRERQVDGVRNSLRAAGPSWSQLVVGGRAVDANRADAGELLGAALRSVRPRAIIASTVLLAQLARSVDTATPVLFSGAADPVHSCLVDSMKHPGRNTTGYMASLPVEGKMVEIARQAFPEASAFVVVVADAADSGGFACAPEPLRTQARLAEQQGCVAGPVQDLDELTGAIDAGAYADAAHALGVPIRFFRVCAWSEAVDLMRVQASRPGDVVLVPHRMLFARRASEAAALFAEHRIAAVFEGLSHAEAGALVAVGPRRPRWPLQAATELAMLTLSGTAAGDLPVRTPAAVDVWIHVGAAKESGRLPSLDVLHRADLLIR